MKPMDIRDNMVRSVRGSLALLMCTGCHLEI